MNKKMSFASVAMILMMAVMGLTSTGFADQKIELKARQNKRINGFQAELRGDYREKSGPDRLNGELGQINIPLATPVAFCLVHAGVSTLVTVADVAKTGGETQAQFELEAEHGDSIPKVVAGDLLQAHQSPKAPFSPNPTCGDVLLLSAPFLK